jgi:hypothetical protein
MGAELTQRPKWEIDQVLERLVGADVRVAAKSFAPGQWDRSKRPPRLVPVREVYLPDNAQPEGLPVFIEGQLRHFERQIGVVFVWLDALRVPETATDGLAHFRGRTVVILRGPAVVELAFPFQVEQLPKDPDNYWRDVRVPRAQFEFQFVVDAPRDEVAGKSARNSR